MPKSDNTTYTILELFLKYKQNSLRYDMAYQRNVVWATKAKSFLIDSILGDFTIPEITIQVTIENSMVLYRVIDGKQRLSAIFEYMNDHFKLSDSNYKGKKFSELSREQQLIIEGYPLLIRKYNIVDENHIWDLFRRMNKYVTPLNHQELRHGTYRGLFISLATELAKEESYWNYAEIFSPTDINRMLNIEFVSELLIIITDGIKDKKPHTIDEKYEQYDFEMPNISIVKQMFLETIQLLRVVMGDITNTWFTRKVNFYALFAAFYFTQKNNNPMNPVNYHLVHNILHEFIGQVKSSYKTTRVDNTINDSVFHYINTLVESSTSVAERSNRTDILYRKIIKSYS